jgi:hypothetical protein
MNENVKVPVYNGIVRKLNLQLYMLDLSWQIAETAGAELRLSGIGGYPFSNDQAHNPINCMYESITDVVWYHLRMYFYFKTAHDIKEFPIKLGFRSLIPDPSAAGKFKIQYQTAVCNFLVQ